jgi:hypothetical protein
MIARAVVDYRGCIEVDGRSPVERAAALRNASRMLNDRNAWHRQRL